MKYAEHEKMHAIREKSQAIGEFLDQLQSEGLSVCEFKTGLGFGGEYGSYRPISKSIEQILADYFEIDLEKIEKEKRQMLEEVRKMNKRDVA